MTYSSRWERCRPPFVDVRIERVGDPNRRVAVRGLVDTGATLSVISTDVAQDLGLAPFHFKRVGTVAGAVVAPFHVVRIVMDTTTEPLRPRGILESPPNGLANRTMLLGLDILKSGTFLMEPDWFHLRLHPARTLSQGE